MTSTRFNPISVLLAFSLLAGMAGEVCAADADDSSKRTDASNPTKIVEIEQANKVDLPTAIAHVTDLNGNILKGPAKVANRLNPKNMDSIIVLDGTRSSTKGNAELSYHWKQTEGENLRLNQNALEKDRVGIRIYKAGTYTFQLTVSDGTSTSEPAKVEINVVTPEISEMVDATDDKETPGVPKPVKPERLIEDDTIPTAIPSISASVVVAAKPGSPVDPKTVVVLDARGSQPKNSGLKYTWKQVSGDDLSLTAEVCAHERLKIRLFNPGIYTFQLTVSDGKIVSQPAVVEVKVVEPVEKKP